MGAMTTAKNEFIGLHENCNSMGSELTLDGGVYWREFFKVGGGGMNEILAAAGTPPLISPRGKTGW